MQKRESKNGRTEPANQGPEPQSARAGAIGTHFCIFWKNSTVHSKSIHFGSLFHLQQKHTKMDPKGAQTEPKNQQTEPQGPTKYEKHTKISHQGWQSGAPSVTMESQGPPKCKKSTKRFPKVRIRHENVPQGAEKHTSTHRHQQPTNQRNKGRHESANKQTNEQTPPQTFTQTKNRNSKTTRPL